MSLNILVPALPGMIEHVSAHDAATVQLTLVALSSRPRLRAACARPAVGPLRPQAGPAGGSDIDRCWRRSAAIAASSIGALIVARIVQAAGASTGIVIGRAIIRDLYDRERAAGIIGLVTSAMVIAPMVAPLIGGLLDTAFGWEAIFIFITVAVRRGAAVGGADPAGNSAVRARRR